MTAVDLSSRWFLCTRPLPDAALRVLCLPHAGGGASAFRGWASAFGPDVEVRAVALPGREARIAEPATIDIVAITAAVRAQADRPFAIYGHSMGGRLGFEITRELRRTGGPLPIALVVAACRPPDQVDTHLSGISTRPDRELLARLVALGGLPTEVVNEPELVDLILPMLRADFGWLDAYRFVDEDPLPVPIVGFAGTDDPALTPVEMVGWVRHTAAGLALTTLSGGHFFSGRQPAGIAGVVKNRLAELMGRDPALTPAGPAADEIHVWYAELDTLPELAAATGELSAGERARASRLHRAVDRHRYVARIVLLRRLLAGYGLALGGHEFPTRPAGKPVAPAGTELCFSSSHSAGAALMAITRGIQVGVDLERVTPMADLDAFASVAYHPSERAVHERLPVADRLGHALRVWTAKEAVLKATGDGLRVEPNRFCFAPDGPTWRAVAPSDLSRLLPWRITHLPLPGAVGAVAVDRSSWRLRFATVGPGDLR